MHLAGLYPDRRRAQQAVTALGTPTFGGFADMGGQRHVYLVEASEHPDYRYQVVGKTEAELRA